MLQMDYSIPQLSSKYASSTMSSGTLSGSCGSRKNRIRTIRLVKQRNSSMQPYSNSRHGPHLGFSIRGGHEHGTGFFVSHVEAGSEAHGQGLKVGHLLIVFLTYCYAVRIYLFFYRLIKSETQKVFTKKLLSKLQINLQHHFMSSTALRDHLYNKTKYF